LRTGAAAGRGGRLEACSQAGSLHDRWETLGLDALVASTTGAAWQWQHVKHKTDGDDAFELARLAAVGELNLARVPSRATAALARPPCC
jgi:hypothetical protein